MFASTFNVMPARALMTDNPQEILAFTVSAFDAGPVALATLVEVRGGGSRALGSHMAIAADGRFCGYVSGGCVEAAVAAEALQTIADGRDRTVLFGDGSPFFDIALPCGGGISVAIHLVRDISPIAWVLKRLDEREAAGLGYHPTGQSIAAVEPATRSAWLGREFLTVYRPSTRLVISGPTIEAARLARLATAAGYAVIAGGDGQGVFNAGLMDKYTAVALLHHDLDREEPILIASLASSAFYIGALGSTRTHKKRVDRLKATGYGDMQLSRIKAPIGMFGPARDATSLAVSVLADVAASRLATYA